MGGILSLGWSYVGSTYDCIDQSHRGQICYVMHVSATANLYQMYMYLHTCSCFIGEVGIFWEAYLVPFCHSSVYLCGRDYHPCEAQQELPWMQEGATEAD